MPISGDGRQEPETSTLVERVRTNPHDEEACRLLVSRHWRLLIGWVRPRVADPSLAEDIAQESLIRALRAIDRLENPDRFVPWLMRIAMNQTVDLTRKRQREPIAADWATAPESEPCDPRSRNEPFQALDAEVTRVQLQTAIDQLPELYRVVVFLRYFEGLSGHQIAVQLGEPEGTIRNRLFRAIEKLRERLVEARSQGSSRPGSDGGSR